MEHRISDILRAHGYPPPESVTPLGGGYYGRAFCAAFGGAPAKIVLKLYLFPGLAGQEARQLRALARHATVSMPEVYFTDIAENGGFDCLAMAFVEGVNVGKARDIPEARRGSLADDIVDNLLSYHRFVHADGFGAIDGERFCSDWRDLYRSAALRTLEKARMLSGKGEIDRETLNTIERAVKLFDSVFYLPITAAHLIHGDYNTWNILAAPDFSRLTGVIDPFNCCYADSEFDLYQLDNANGASLHLLERYAEKSPLAENFPIKRAYYEVFTELNHYFDARVPVNQPLFRQQTDALSRALAACR